MADVTMAVSQYREFKLVEGTLEDAGWSSCSWMGCVLDDITDQTMFKNIRSWTQTGAWTPQPEIFLTIDPYEVDFLTSLCQLAPSQ